MKRAFFFLFLCAAPLLATSGCISEQGIDKDKFSDLDRTARDLRTAITASDPCSVPEELQQRLAAEIAAVKDRTDSKGERDLTAAYARVLATYQDGLLLCRSRGHLSDLKLIPGGRIVLTQELDPLVDRYKLPTEEHVYKPTGQHIRSIDRRSIEVIWDRMGAQIKNAENILFYH